MESGENPEQSRCGIRRSNSHTANPCTNKGEGGKEAGERWKPFLHSRESEYFVPPHSSRCRSSERGTAKALPRKKGDGRRARPPVAHGSRHGLPFSSRATPIEETVNRNTSKAPASAAALLAVSLATANAAVVTFDDLPFGPGNNHEHEWDGTATAGFSSQGVTFSHAEWNGFAYSRETDTITAGYTNQYSAFTGGGADGSAAYGIGYTGYTPTTITYSAPTDLTGTSAFITNTTYAALSMANGDGFAKQFGGASGDDADWLLLTITGYVGGGVTGTVDFYLADFRDADNANDYIIDDWTVVDFSPLGVVEQLHFSMSSSDNNEFGMKTPSYFAIDNVPVPEPSALLLAVSGAGIFLRRKRS